MPAVKPKLAVKKSRPAPKEAPVEEVDYDTEPAIPESTVEVEGEAVLPTEEQTQSIEERIAQAEAALANTIDRIDELDGVLAEKLNATVNAVKPSLLEWLNLKLEQRETSLFYQIVDYFGQCPEWELKKVPEGEKNKTNGEDLFASCFKDGWRFLGNFTHPSDAAQRYTLFCRPKGGPITDEEYLKSYERFKTRRDALLAEQRKGKQPPAKQEQMTAEEPAAEEAPKAKSKVKAPVKKPAPKPVKKPAKK